MLRMTHLAAVAAVSFVTLPALASDGLEPAKFAGAWTVDLATNTQVFVPASEYVRRTAESVVALDSLPGSPTPAPNAGFSQPTANLPVFGDDYTLAAAGSLTEMTFSIFNSNSNVSGTPTPMTAINATINFYDSNTFAGAALSTPLGSFGTTFSFGAFPLSPGFFTLLTVTGISGVSLPSVDPVLITQQLNPTGSTRHGVVSIAAPVVGTTGGNDFYLAGNPTPAEGFYTSGTTPINVSYKLVVPEPATLGALAAASLVVMRRRRV
jgi:hypothetical protein